MVSTEPSLDLSALLKEATEDTDTTNLPLHMTTWQQEYKEKLGLSSENTTSSTTTSDQILPIHPYPLGLEVEHYQDQLDNIKKQYIQLGTKHRFLNSILQDPPLQVEPLEIQELDIDLFQKYSDLAFELRNVIRLKHTIAEENTNNEKVIQELNQTRETVIELIDTIEELKNTLEPLNSKISTFTALRTPEEAKKILQEQTILLAKINDGIDTMGDILEEMDNDISVRSEEIKELETKWQHVDYKAKEAIMYTGGENVKIVKQATWYNDIIQLWHTTFGIQDILLDQMDLLQVTYTTGDILSIHSDILTEQVTGLEVNNEEIDLTDLETMVNGQLVKDVAYMVLLETLARTRKP